MKYGRTCSLLLALSLGVGHACQVDADTGLVLFKSGATRWRYLDTLEPPPKTWTAPDFDDSKWKSGKAPLGYGERDIATKLSYGDDPQKKHPVAFFRRTVSLPDDNELALIEASVRADDGAIIFVNGTEADRLNILPPDRVRQGYLGYQGLTEGDYIKLFLPVHLFHTGKNVIAVSVHQRAPSSSDLVLDMELRGFSEGEADARRKADLFPGSSSASARELYINDNAFMRHATYFGKEWKHANQLPTLKRLTRGVRLERPCKLRLPPSQTVARTPGDLYRENRDSILAIFHVSEVHTSASMGSGAIISESGAAITNLHVISPRAGDRKTKLTGEELIVAVNMAGDFFPVTKILAASGKNDIAIIQLKGKSFRPLPIVSGREVGSRVSIISSPHHQMFHLSSGAISRYAMHRLDATRRTMAISAPVGSGSSGGAVLDEFGNVVGIAAEVLPLARDGISVAPIGDEGILKIQPDEETGMHIDRNHEMTISVCVPASSILDLIK